MFIQMLVKTSIEGMIYNYDLSESEEFHAMLNYKPPQVAFGYWYSALIELKTLLSSKSNDDDDVRDFLIKEWKDIYLFS
ncbi:hypothetical protein C0583_01735 [Candidatus Parcubacteria bacterium]|nr:MAG: hypothetical protein C0583_01735 [Candidatus Parcubacteria bacterium]